MPIASVLRVTVAAFVSTNVASAAPRESASIPRAPVPAKRSRTRMPSMSPSTLKIAPRTLSDVGRTLLPLGLWSVLPLWRPATTRMARRVLLDGCVVADALVPERRLLRGACEVQLDVHVVHVRLRRIEVLLALVVLAVAVRVVAHLAVPAAEPRLAVEDQALDAHPARERCDVAVAVRRQQQLHERVAVLHRRRVPVDGAAGRVQA